MRYFYSLLFLISFQASIAQDTIIKRNSTRDTAFQKQPRLVDYGTFFRHDGKLIKQEQLYWVMAETKDAELIKLVVKADRAKRWEYIGFLSIPAGLVLGGCQLAYLFQGSGEHLTPAEEEARRKRGNTIFVTAISASVITVSCPVISVVAKCRKAKHNKKAIELYDQRF